MTTIRPFKAIRASRDKVHLFASRSYLSYSDEILKEKLENNPFTFLHIINPEYKRKNKKIGSEKFKLVKKRFDEFLRKKILKKDKNPALYLYQQIKEKHEFTGIIAASSIKDYFNGVIKIHEETIAEREEMFKNYLEITRFNADPVLLAYKTDKSIDLILKKKTLDRPEYEFTTTDKSLHKLWIIDNESEIKNITDLFKGINSIYLADGHHRTASSALLSKEKSFGNSSDYFMSLLISEKQLNIINFNRLVKRINNYSVSEFLKKIEEKFLVKKSPICNLSNVEEIGMYIAEESYILKPKKKSFSNDCVNKLGSAILSKNILIPILGILDEKTDKNVSFISGNIPLSVIKKNIDDKKNTVAFILKSISIDTLKTVADQGKVMPPKSTYIEPKLRSGLTIYEL